MVSNITLQWLRQPIQKLHLQQFVEAVGIVLPVLEIGKGIAVKADSRLPMSEVVT